MKFMKLRGRLAELGLTYSMAANFLLISENTLVSRINGRSSWTREEMWDMCKLLGIEPADMHLFFYEVELAER